MYFHRDRGFAQPAASEITPQSVYQSRREWLRHLALAAAGSSLGAFAARDALAAPIPPRAALEGVHSDIGGAQTMEKPTAHEDATGYNNFYEFGTDKADPSQRAQSLKTQPWTVSVDGEVKSPRRFDLDALMKLGAIEERVYRLRCVEGWSMVIPWLGWSLSHLIKAVEPSGSARFVQFVTLADATQMPGLGSRVLDWPYVEALRLDEAMHPLTMLVFGMYGQVLPPQNGAPVRLAVPWKYGFKSAKSIVGIRLLAQQPGTSWEKAAPREYGFYSNVNPNVDHPRWSQASERRIGEDGLFAKKRRTLPFNGYAAQVGALYAGMDLRKFF
ncbi:MAG: mononuclear molybdenum enzyme YedY [Rubrivivax sp. SCN 71-131]|jgi:sulfoxide reductase catalytic subunit YedY|nr:MAG: mononuclear molybdenum enzyme YedY [Rubrivivax sp. SCN 71-131]